MPTMYYPPTQNGLQKTLDAQLDQGVTSSVTLNNVTGVQNKPGVILINRIDTDGNEKSTSLREFVTYTGVSGSTLTGLARGIGGSSDQDHAVGSVVEFTPDITWAQGIIDIMGVEHDPDDGTHTDITADTLTAKTTNGNLTIAGNGTGKVNTTAVFQTPQTYTPAGAATATLDLSTGNEHRITMPAGNITIAISNETNGQKFLVSILQDSGGSRTVTWFSTIKWAGGSAPTLTTTGNKRDVFGFIVTGTDTYDGFVVGQNI